jgi:hypothetical protein
MMTSNLDGLWPTQYEDSQPLRIGDSTDFSSGHQPQAVKNSMISSFTR